MNYKTLVFISLAMILFSSTLSAYSGGDGSAGNPYQIANPADFQQLSTTASDWDKCFILTANINLIGLTFTQAPLAPDTTRDDYNFSGTPFSGIFDGKGYVISNLTLSGSGQEFVGLFGFISADGQVKNLGVKKANISGGYLTGGLAGENDGTLTSSYITGSISSTNDLVGGLVGYNHSAVSYCYAAVSASGSYYVGGLTGFSDGAVTSCYAAGSVNGFDSVGGLTGYDMGVTTCCYATCHVYGSYNVGGLAGVGDGGTITACYSVGDVSGSYSVGGLLGTSYANRITSCFWDNQTSGQISSAGGTGKTTAQMKALSIFTNAGWDFVGETINGPIDYWQMPDNSYPRLAWESIIVDVTPPADMTDFICVSGNTQLNLSWANPADDDLGGVLIVRRTGQAPSGSPTAGTPYSVGALLAEGTVIYAGSGSNFSDTSLTNGTTYYYQAYSYDTFYNYGAGVFVDGTPAVPIDTTPDSFTFAAQAKVALNTTMTSNTITISGINAAASVAIGGGTYSINSGLYTSAAGFVNNGDKVTVRQISSNNFLTAANAVLTIGGVSGTFSVTTLSLSDDKTPPGNVTGVVCTSGDTQQYLGWTNPTTSDFEGVVVVHRAGQSLSGSPKAGAIYNVGNSLAGGTVIYVGSDTGFTDTSLTNGTKYYYKVFSFDRAKNYAGGVSANGIPVSTITAAKSIVTAGKLPGLDSIQFTGSLDAAASVLETASNITVSLKSADMTGQDFIFPINAVTYKKGKIACKFTALSLSFDPQTGMMSFGARNCDLTGLACPITVNVTIGSYAARAVLDEPTVNGVQPCPVQLVQGIKNSLQVTKYKFTKGKKAGTDSLTVSGTFTVTADYTKAPLAITVGNQTFAIDGSKMANKESIASCAAKTTGGIAARLDYDKCTFSISIKNAAFSQTGDITFGITCFGVSLSGLETISLN